jgi:tetratricopeptide (TPR) repeat protein
MRRWLWLLVAVSACAHPKPAPAPDLHTARLAGAAAQVRAGCLDCLIAAYREYDALRAIPAAVDAATVGAVRAAALIALRERELGMVDDGYLQRARDAAASRPGLPVPLLRILDVIDAVPRASVGAGRPTSDADLERMRIERTNRPAWTDLLREAAGTDEAIAYTWLSFMCGSNDARAPSRDEILTVVAAFHDMPLVAYREASCRTIAGPRLQSLETADPRFLEVPYFLGQLDVAQQHLDDADRAFARAYAWHPQWPTLTLTIANVAMTAEEFDRALQMYDATLEIEPKAVDALLGRVRALTYLGRHEEAIATVDQLLAERWYLGDARYWRALNETQLERYDAAWADIELAAKLLINADVPKLAGIISYRRKELEVSRAKFDESRSRNVHDCETGFYLGVVLAELRQWPRTAEVLPETARCLDNAEEKTRAEIAELEASTTEPAARKAKKIAKREQLIAAGRRMRAQSWFNTAVAYFNLARKDDARDFAEKVTDDEVFGERARDLIARLGK